MRGWQEFEFRPAFEGAGSWSEPGASGGSWWRHAPDPARMLRHFARRFPFGPGGFGPGMGPRMGPRMFGRGDLKYGVLAMLEERPKHGYEMIKELEERSGGFYTPSAGAIYPTLQLLEDRGWVTAETVEGKKVYTISDDGRQALAEFRQRGEERSGPGFGPWGGFGPGEWPERPRGPHHRRGAPERFPWEARQEMRGLAHQMREVARLLRQAVVQSGGDPARLQQIEDLLERVRTELQRLAQQQPGKGSAPSGSSTPSAPDDTTLI